jgi:hypothetical protein
MIAFRASAGLVCSQKPAPEKFVTQWTLRTGLFAGSCAAGDVAPDRLVGTARRADSSQDRRSLRLETVMLLFDASTLRRGFPPWKYLYRLPTGIDAKSKASPNGLAVDARGRNLFETILA